MTMKYKLLLLSLICLAATVSAQFLVPPLVNVLWLLTLTSSLAYLYFPIKLRFKPVKIDYILVGILIFALVLRLFNLTSLPYQVHGDEAEIGLGAIRIIQGMYHNLAQVGWYDVPLLSFVFPIPLFLLLGVNLLALRLTSVILGLISIYLLYLLVSMLTNKPRMAQLAAFIMSFTALHIHYSRTGFHYMQAVLAVLLVFYFFWRGNLKKSLRDFALAGLAAGVSLQVYYSARVALVIIAVYLLIEFIRYRQIKSHLKAMTQFLYGLAVSFLPMAVYFLLHPVSFLSRTHEVLLFENLPHVIDVYKTTILIHIILGQLYRTVGFFFNGNDASLQYGYRMGDLITTVLFIGGLLFFLLKIFKKNYFLFTVIWVAAMLGSTIFTIDAPFSPRMLPVVPAVAFLAAYSFDNLLIFFKKYKFNFISLIFVILMIFFITYINVKTYFAEYPKVQPVNPHTSVAYRLAMLDKQKPGRFFCLINSDVPFDYPTIKFLAPKVKGMTTSREDPKFSLCQVVLDGYKIH